MKTAQAFTSALILSYNSSKTIAQTIESILNQNSDYPFEIIIGDDGSTDGTREICLKYRDKFPDKIRLLFHETNGGLVKNWFALIREAKGKYIASCAADDYWHNPRKLQLQVDYLEARPDHSLVYSDYDLLNSKTGKVMPNYLKASGKKCPEGGNLTKEIYKGRVPIAALTVCLNKDMFMKYIPMEDYIRLKFPIEDWPSWIILSKHGKIGFMPESTATFRKGHESMSNPLQYERIEKKFRLEQTMYEYISNMFPEDLNYNETSYQNYIDTLLLNLSYKKNDFEAAKKYAKRLADRHFKSRKVMMAENRLLFKLFIILQKMKGHFSLI